MTTVDLNADLGEFTDETGIEIDTALLDLISSANVACGGHAGDSGSILRVCRQAAGNGVAIGAQISYVDREGFGRTRLDVAPDLLTRQLADQLQLLDFVAAQANTEIHYVKPHGALYNAAANDPALARVIVTSMQRHRLEVPVLTLPDSALAQTASAAGFEVFAEYFADRAYDEHGRLVPRSEPGAVLTDEFEIVQRVVAAVTGDQHIDSVCLHSDTPGAVALADAVRTALHSNGVLIEPFVQVR